MLTGLDDQGQVEMNHYRLANCTLAIPDLHFEGFGESFVVDVAGEGLWRVSLPGYYQACQVGAR
jgi:hypothetical protein